MENFDLLPYGYENDMFRIAFDFYTPRPQFVIIPRQVESMNPEFSAMTAEQTCVLIEAAKSVLSNFRIPRGILSIHRGSWKSRPAKSFHCHLCVDAEKYLEIFERKKRSIHNWPSVAYVTRQWVWNKDPRSYAQNVRGYPYKTTFKDDVSEILKIIQQCGSDPSPLSTGSEFSPEAPLGRCLVKVVYHPSHPKIGFVGKKDSSVYDLHEILWEIEGFARARGLTDSETDDKNNGCHVCLYFGSAAPDWDNISETSSDYVIVGYLVVSGPRFYQMCPPEHRELWFDKFQRSNFKCFT